MTQATRSTSKGVDAQAFEQLQAQVGNLTAGFGEIIGLLKGQQAGAQPMPAASTEAPPQAQAPTTNTDTGHTPPVTVLPSDWHVEIPGVGEPILMRYKPVMGETGKNPNSGFHGQVRTTYNGRPAWVTVLVKYQD